MKDWFIKYLEAMGVSQSTIIRLKASHDKDALEGAKVEDLVAEFNTMKKELIKNEIGEELRTAEEGKVYTIAEQKIIKDFALPKEKVDALPNAKKGERYAALVKLAKEEITANMNKDTKTVQEELAAANVKIKDYEEVQLPAAKSSADKAKAKFSIDRKHEKLVSSFTLRDIPVEAVMPSVQSYIDSKYDVSEDEQGELIYKVKGTDKKPMNKANTGFLTPKEIIEEKLKEYKFLKESNADDGKKKIEATPDGSERQVTGRRLNGLDKAKAHAETLAKEVENPEE